MLSEVVSRISRLNKTRSGYEVESKYSLDWLMFAISDGDVFAKEKIENEYTTVEVLKFMYFKQVKTLKELESMQK